MNAMDTRGGVRTDLTRMALLWGAAWGLGEATLGHLLHLVRVPGLPGLVMAPFAVLVMGRVAARSRSASAVFLAGIVAAGSKLFDLFVPGTDFPAIANPMQAILLEALAGTCWVAFERSRKNGNIPVLSAVMRSGVDRDVPVPR
jgi:hypothetical protein